MNRLQAILVSLFFLAFVQYARAGVVLASGAGCADAREAIGSEFPVVAGADSESTEGYQSQDSLETGEVPEAVGPADEMNRTDSPSGNESEESIGDQPPMGTGTLPETVEPGDKPGETGAPPESTPGSSY